MNYRHIYHAGNFADVFKHCALIALWQTLCQKNKPICYLDTHAGIGRYNLTSLLAQKTCEFENGISKIFNCATKIAIIRTYQKIVHDFNPQDTLEYYPGSPAIIRELLRPQDQMILVELHGQDSLTLQQEFRGQKNIAVHKADGYQSIKAFLPPKTGRALVLIDPPFEEKDEFAKILTALTMTHERFPTGIYAVWYPLKELALAREFQRSLRQLPYKNIVSAEFGISNHEDTLGLNSCGMAIVNAPWQFAAQMRGIANFLKIALGLDATSFAKVKYLIEPK